MKQQGKNIQNESISSDFVCNVHNILLLDQKRGKIIMAWNSKLGRYECDRCGKKISGKGIQLCRKCNEYLDEICKRDDNEKEGKKKDGEGIS